MAYLFACATFEMNKGSTARRFWLTRAIDTFLLRIILETSFFTPSHVSR